MKKLLLILALVFIPRLCFAALAATTTWEVRSDATANNVNGGGFNASNAQAGTDYSQQTTAHLTITDLVIGADNTTVSSVLTPFDSLDPGNILHITAGTNFTQGWYEVVSVTTAVATLDRACGTALATGGTAYLGGAMSLQSTLDDDFFEVPVDDNVVYVKTGTYTLGETVGISADSASGFPIIIEGYNTTRGDKPTDSTKPTFVQGTGVFTMAGEYNSLRNISFTGSGTSILSANAGVSVIQCKIYNSSATPGRDGLLVAGASNHAENEIISLFGDAVEVTSSSSTVFKNCYIHDSNNGVNFSFSGAALQTIVDNCLITNNVTNAILISATTFHIANIYNNTILGRVTTPIGTGISLGATAQSNIKGNIIAGFTTGVTATASIVGNVMNYNNLYNNTTDRSNITAGADDVDVDPAFTNEVEIVITDGDYDGTNLLTKAGANFDAVVDNQDFAYITGGTGVTVGKYLITAHTTTTLTITPDAGSSNSDTDWIVTTGHNFQVGTNVKDLGFPGAFPGGLTTGYRDIGAVERQEPAGGGAGGGRGARFTIQ